MLHFVDVHLVLMDRDMTTLKVLQLFGDVTIQIEK